MAVILAQAVGGCRLVHALGLEDEAQVFYVALGGEFIHLAQGEVHLLAFCRFLAATALVVGDDVVVFAQVNKVGVVVHNACLGLVVARTACHADVELAGRILFQTDVNPVFGDEFASLFHGSLVAVFEHFKLQLGAAYQGTQCHGDRQTNHSCAGYSHTHCVFQNVSTKLDADALGHLSE